MLNRMICASLLVLLFPTAVYAQSGSKVPYIRVGEELTFSVRSSRFGNMGTAVMRTVRDTAQGRDAYRLSFDYSARITLFKVSDRTRSWVDAETMNTLRYEKCERSPLGSRDEDARISQDAGSNGTWSDAHGEHPLAAADPLDELAFIYLIRTAASTVDVDGEFVNRHFDAKRNSVKLTSRGTARVAALGDSLDATVIHMQVMDPRQKNGSGGLTFYIGTGPDHLPLRIETSMPMAGNITMTLRSVTVQSVMAHK